MSDASNAVMALKNAWNGAVAACDAVREMAPAVAALPEADGLEPLDLEHYYRVAASQAMAVVSLRGLIEDLQRLREKQRA